MKIFYLLEELEEFELDDIINLMSEKWELHAQFEETLPVKTWEGS